MATHSSILAWEIPWAEEPSKLSMRSQRVRHDLVTKPTNHQKKEAQVHCNFQSVEILFPSHQGFPGGTEDKVSACNAGDLSLIPGLGRSPGEVNGNPLQYSCQENPMDRWAWWATVHGVAKSQTWLSTFTFHFHHTENLFLINLKFPMNAQQLLLTSFQGVLLQGGGREKT